jgi:mycothiol synthase
VFDRCPGQCFGGGIRRKKAWRDQIDPLVSALSRKDRGRQELEGVLVAQGTEFLGASGVFLGQPGRNGPGATGKASRESHSAAGYRLLHRNTPPRRGSDRAPFHEHFLGVGAVSLARVHSVEVIHELTPGDIAEIAGLCEAAQDVDNHKPLSEQKWMDLTHGRRIGFASVLARDGDDRHLVGYAQLGQGQESWAVEVVVHPEVRDSVRSVAEILLSAALDEVAKNGGGEVSFWVPHPDDTSDAMAITHGLTTTRDLLQLRRSLPIPIDNPVLAVRGFVPGVDEEAWLTSNARAFATHPEQGAWDLETLLEREEAAWFDPEGFLLHERDGRLAGSCWTKIHADLQPALGEIYVIGVDPDFQGLGLGRDLVVAGLDHMANEGITIAMLYVDADNEAAMGLYGRLGFAVDHTDRAYQGAIPAQL